eukprot:Protomagalhaensia_wolfi_Nauph_80__2238@NODE_2456_length_1087_cov_126_570160_g1924_i0_p1_GENE_NODE_2456_length_1087_cov_126_570160_g1924_i0NODE_2456_length_1087_cov_126_570160_g1924_i0_p1_ORF_typecomplete_len302_score47_54PAN_4/PF14295_6/1_3e03PAN_4/PF14295_6/1_3e02PAN_4/PF14295_6/1_1e06PAN_4/PF14295_6/7e03_NODE_2456_length_1087_cov_126_570160_g1924_i019924
MMTIMKSLVLLQVVSGCWVYRGQRCEEIPSSADSYCQVGSLAECCSVNTLTEGAAISCVLNSGAGSAVGSVVHAECLDATSVGSEESPEFCISLCDALREASLDVSQSEVFSERCQLLHWASLATRPFIPTIKSGCLSQYFYGAPNEEVFITTATGPGQCMALCHAAPPCVSWAWEVSAVHNQDGACILEGPEAANTALAGHQCECPGTECLFCDLHQTCVSKVAHLLSGFYQCSISDYEEHNPCDHPPTRPSDNNNIEDSPTSTTSAETTVYVSIVPPQTDPVAKCVLMPNWPAELPKVS